MLFQSIIDRVMGRKNIAPCEWEPKSWDSEHAQASLRAMLDYAEKSAKDAIHWYWDKKRWKAISSRAFRLGAILTTAAAAMIPVISATGWLQPASVTDSNLWTLRMNQIGYLCLGVAALCVALDRFLSGSSSWIRYVTTATAIQNALERFRLDWDRQTAALAGRAPEGEELIALINRITEFSATVRTLVEEETKAWAVEFQVNLAEFEKSSEKAREALQQSSADAAAAAAKAGGIELTVSGAGAAAAGYDVLIDGRIVKTAVAHPTCGILGIAPGLHELTVRATFNGQPQQVSKLVTIEAGAAAQAEAAFTKASATAAGAGV